MTLEDAKKLYELQEEGCSVMIDSGRTSPFVVISESNGQYTYSSSVSDESSLEEVPLEDIEVYVPSAKWGFYLGGDDWDECLGKKERQET